MNKYYNGKCSYKVFPWDPNGQKSSSHPLWLIAHLTSSLFHVLISLYMLSGTTNPGVIYSYTVSHWTFVGLISINMWNFGESSLFKALAINLTGILLSTFCWYSDRRFSYFLVICAPVFIEAIKLIRTHV